MGEANSDQAAVLDFMASPKAYWSGDFAVDRIETHASVVFLAGTHAYKIKRAVKYPFLDFSTLEKRHRALLNELALNRRTAPQLYLEVIPITVGDKGEFRLGGQGEPKSGHWSCAGSIRRGSTTAWRRRGACRSLSCRSLHR